MIIVTVIIFIFEHLSRENEKIIYKFFYRIVGSDALIAPIPKERIFYIFLMNSRERFAPQGRVETLPYVFIERSDLNNSRHLQHTRNDDYRMQRNLAR